MSRSVAFSGRPEARFWWHQFRDHNYVPLIYKALTDEEWAVLEAWYEETGQTQHIGELCVPGASLLAGFISGNGLSAIVQCGHYVGYSTLMLGFLLRGMRKRNCLMSIDIDPGLTEITQRWIDHAGLQEQVRLVVSDSAAPEMPAMARDYLGRAPQLVFIDSSHQYDHTLKELELWWDALAPGGLMALHDVSLFAQTFDPPRQNGGALRAVQEWARTKGVSPFLLNAFNLDAGLEQLTYKDRCGMGLLQKPL